MIQSIELQKAIYSSLALGYSVFEIVPVANSFPYITIGESNEVEDFTKTDLSRFRTFITIHSWSLGESSIESKTMKHFIYNQMKDLKIPGFKVENVALSLSQTLKEQGTDTKTIFHTVQEFEIIINKLI